MNFCLQDEIRKFLPKRYDIGFGSKVTSKVYSSTSTSVCLGLWSGMLICLWIVLFKIWIRGVLLFCQDGLERGPSLLACFIRSSKGCNLQVSELEI